MSGPGREAATNTDSLPRPVNPGVLRYGPDALVPGVVQNVASGEVLMVGYLDGEALEATQRTRLVHFHSRSRGRLWRKGETSGNVLHLESIAQDCDGDALLLGVRADGPACHTGARSCFQEPAGTQPPREDPLALDVEAGDERSGSSAETVRKDRSASRAEAGEQPRAGSAEPAETAGAEAAHAAPAPERGDPGIHPAARDGFGWLDTLWETIEDRAARRPEGSYTARLIESGVDAAARKVLEEAGEVVLAAKDDAAAATNGERARTRELLRSEVADLVFHLLVLAAERGLTPSEVIAELRARHTGAAGER